MNAGVPAATALILLLATGCGQKGALYLPDAKPSPVAAGPATTTAPANSATPAADESSRRKAPAPATPDPATTQ
jgi:predicted small lipoprotein YifL